MTQPWPETRDTLLTRLRNPADQQAWEDFVMLYQPLIVRFAIRQGLQDADANDISQRVLWTVARAAENFQIGERHGSFRGWLATVTTNAVLNLMQRESKHRGSGRTSVWELMEQVAEPAAELSAAWRDEHRSAMFRIAAQKVRSKFTEDVWRLFWRTAVDGEAIEAVAKDLSKSIGAAYAARSRVLAAIRKETTHIAQSESS
ncbi:MAG: sigma-70 family RNA polymerase sigma factor [Pirellulaceae bacterium]|nr:sigma-70 family RNA polymerase sigma factor [Pirellulaceae bacterium]